jgi:hypothetical protein
MVSKKPWSGYWWAIKFGLISLRYDDNLASNTMNTLDANGQTINYTWQQSINKFPQPADYNKAVSNKVDMARYYATLSAAEKYDRLLCDPNFTLTNKMKQRGNTVQKDANGDIPSWMGICHGWAVSAYTDPKPIRPVTINNCEGIPITFHLHDVMGLASLYWANANYVSNFVGYRCGYTDFSKIPSDPTIGTWLDYNCFAINPRTFHLVFTNQIGLNDKSFVFEPQVDNEIWNHPTSGFEYIYYHPVTKIIGTLEESKISVADAKLVTNVPFLTFALTKINPIATSIVAVKLTVYYIVENSPTTSDIPTAENEKNTDYLYYLELDAGNNVVGGEWRFNTPHPNYIYGPRENDEVLNPEDKIINTFSGNPAELTRMLPYSKVAAIRFAPLRAVYKYLVQQASVAK